MIKTVNKKYDQMYELQKEHSEEEEEEERKKDCRCTNLKHDVV